MKPLTYVLFAGLGLAAYGLLRRGTAKASTTKGESEPSAYVVTSMLAATRLPRKMPLAFLIVVRDADADVAEPIADDVARTLPHATVILTTYEVVGAAVPQLNLNPNAWATVGALRDLDLLSGAATTVASTTLEGGGFDKAKLEEVIGRTKLDLIVPTPVPYTQEAAPPFVLAEVHALAQLYANGVQALERL